MDHCYLGISNSAQKSDSNPTTGKDNIDEISDKFNQIALEKKPRRVIRYKEDGIIDSISHDKKIPRVKRCGAYKSKIDNLYNEDGSERKRGQHPSGIVASPGVLWAEKETASKKSQNISNNMNYHECPRK